MEIVKEVTVGELKDLWDSKKYTIEIDTPDGFQKITNWFDKGVLSAVSVTTKSGKSTVCAVNHLIQKNTEEWVPAESLVVGDLVITSESNTDRVISVDRVQDVECYDFTVDHPNHRYWGDGFSSHNSGKSYICSGNAIKNAQEMGIFVVLIDSEQGCDESWLKALGVDTSEEKLLKLNVSMVGDVSKIISDFVKEYREIAVEDRQEVLFVIDSLGFLTTPIAQNQAETGDLKGDMGHKPKQLKALITNCVNSFGDLGIGLLAVNHSMESQDIYNPDPKIGGGQGAVYASSIVVAMKKMKLKEDEDGNKTSTVNGIRAGCKIMKTRFSKPFEDIELQIPYSTGMSPHTGLFDLFEKKGFIKKEGNRYTYIALDGSEHKYYRKEWNKNLNGIFDLVMKEFFDKQAIEEAKNAKQEELVEDTDE